MVEKKSPKDDWNFDEIVKEVDNAEVVEDNFGEGKRKCVFLGSVLNIAPSGKYYMPWTSNQTQEDVEADSEYFEELEEILGERGLYLESGEGDPLDMFVCKSVDEDEDCVTPSDGYADGGEPYTEEELKIMNKGKKCD